MSLFTPLYLFILLIFTTGNRPHGLKIGILNEEDINCDEFLSKNYSYDCKTEGLSCLFVNYILDNNLQKISYKNIESIQNDTRHGKIDGFLHIPANFSREFLLIQNVFDILEFNNSHINVYLDQAYFFIREYTKATVANAYNNFIDEIMPKCDRKPEMYKSNMIFRDYKDDAFMMLEYDNNREVMPAVFQL